MIHKCSNHGTAFSILSNYCVRNSNLSLRAKGFFRYVMAQADTWKFHMSELKRHFPSGIRAVRSAVAELEKMGYARTTSGRLEFFETPPLRAKAPDSKRSICRLAKSERLAHFSITADEAFLRPDLSMEAKGLLFYLLTQRGDWRIELESLARTLKVTRGQIRRAVAALETAGYMRRSPSRVDGRNCGWTFEVYETLDLNPDAVLQNQPVSTTVSRSAENGTLTRSTVLRKKKHTKEGCEFSEIQETLQVEGDADRQSFDRLAAEYPAHRRGNLDDAFGEYKEALRSGEPIPNIPALVDAVRSMAASDAWNAEEGRYVPRLAKWIHDRQWQGVVPPPAEVELEPDLSPAEVLAWHRQRVGDLARDWQCQHPGEPITETVISEAAVRLNEIPAWAHLILAACDDRVLPLRAGRMVVEMEEKPEVMAFMTGSYGWVVENVNNYLEDHNVPTRA